MHVRWPFDPSLKGFFALKMLIDLLYFILARKSKAVVKQSYRNDKITINCLSNDIDFRNGSAGNQFF